MTSSCRNLPAAGFLHDCFADFLAGGGLHVGGLHGLFGHLGRGLSVQRLVLHG